MKKNNAKRLFVCFTMLVLLAGCGSTGSGDTMDSLDGTWSNTNEQELITDLAWRVDEQERADWEEQYDSIRFTSVQFETGSISTDDETGDLMESGTYTFFLGSNVVRSGDYKYDWSTRELIFTFEWIASRGEMTIASYVDDFTYGTELADMSMQMDADEFDSTSQIYLTKEE